MSEVRLILGDALQILPTLEAGSVDVVVTDPPYGIGKAEWDNTFSTGWMEEAARVSYKIVFAPGTWNLLRCPQKVARMAYRWTAAAHLVNGMTRGRLGFGNWIPWVIYSVDYSHADYRQKALEWCRNFGDWCRSQKIRNSDLDDACGTASMGDWWTGRSLPWCRVPAMEHWERIRDKFSPPPFFNEFPTGAEAAAYRPQGDCRSFVVGTEKKADHPCPKPLAVMKWVVELVSKPGDTILDPFMGSGTTGVACVQTGRNFIGIERDPAYYAIAQRRIAEAQGVGTLFPPARTMTASLLDGLEATP